MAEKSLAPKPRARAVLYASRAAAAAGTGTLTLLAASTIGIEGEVLCARSIVKPGSMSPFRTSLDHAI